MHETVKVYSRYDKRTEAKHRCKAMVQNVREHGLPCHVSFTAGTYVCNCVMYNVLHLCATKYPNIRAGFIHVPFACEQVVGKASTMASMPLETIAKSLEYWELPTKTDFQAVVPEFWCGGLLFLLFSLLQTIFFVIQ